MNIDRISRTFGRDVIGIHNTTCVSPVVLCTLDWLTRIRRWGLLFDLIECLIQRAFYYQTADVRVAHACIKAILVDPTVSKVVLIGHSQGGIILSLAIDQLLTELSPNFMSKIEVYTFGSAASHFSNPLLSLVAAHGQTDSSSSFSNAPLQKRSEATQSISHIEHYANEYDMVPRWGVLHCTRNVLNNRYAGAVFVRKGASGHLFNQHYMDPMFPVPEENSHWLRNSFLDRITLVDQIIAIDRDKEANSSLAGANTSGGLEFGDGEVVPEPKRLPSADRGGSAEKMGDVLTFARSDSGHLSLELARGKTVRQLSRLWRYQNGRSPSPPSPLQIVRRPNLSMHRSLQGEVREQRRMRQASSAAGSAPWEHYDPLLAEVQES